MAEKHYRQCRLQYTVGDSISTLTTWIPERAEGVHITPGATLRIKTKEEDTYGSERWTVVEIGSKSEPESRVKAKAHLWTQYRSSTDI
jgi:hypothetical protein